MEGLRTRERGYGDSGRTVRDARRVKPQGPGLAQRWGAAPREDRLESVGEEAAGGHKLIHDWDLAWLQQADGEEAAGGDKLIHDRDLAWLQQADVVVAEVTQPSLGVGYELGRAVALHKPVLCLFRPKSGRVLSAMIRGAANGSRFQVWDYEEAEVEALLDRYFEAYPPEQVAASPDPTA
ncbi:hypothetical protein E5288_WYG011298 [Bos mutus]|uniref:2'-deoxynucleoside 5'-phosphate N-hydrolase 1 n=1 Tax=Bos mutus TaxID=72004 RepID=A0A6B0RDA5_9CETA|nr:hypothetical protein [Bos mutus]